MRAFLHFFIVLFSAGFIGSAARTCVRNMCNAHIISMLSISGAGALVSMILVLTLLINVEMIAKYEWIIDLLLVIAWSAVTGLTMFTIETLVSPLTAPLIAFTWVALALQIIAFTIATFGCDGPSMCANHTSIDRDLLHAMASLASAPSEFQAEEAANSDATDQDTERDATPELAYIPHTQSASVQANENV